MREVYAISKIAEGESAVVTIYSNWKTAVSAMERELLDIYEDLINDFDYYTDINELKEDFKGIYVHRNIDGDIVCISHSLTRIELTVADFDDEE
jgi:3-keto-L-gulonate-6-phosphate decarboxylase